MTPPQIPERKRVLAVDDTDLVSLLLRRILEPAGYEVESAHDGMAGLTKFREGHWDIVLTDRAMPHMTGEDLAAEIKHTHPHVPIVLITGSGWAVNRRELFDAVIEKPFKQDELLGCVARLVDGRK